MAEKEEKSARSDFFFPSCAGLFSLIWSAVKGGHYVTSQHTHGQLCDCQTHGVVGWRCGGRRGDGGGDGGGGALAKRKDIGPWETDVDGCESSFHPSSSCDVGLIMRQFKYLSAVQSKQPQYCTHHHRPRVPPK